MTTRQKILHHLLNEDPQLRREVTPKFTSIELADTLGVSTGGAKVALRELVVAGVLEVVASRSGPGGGTSYRVLKDVCRCPMCVRRHLIERIRAE